MIYILEKRHEFGGGTMETHWEVISYTGISKIGILLNGKIMKKGTRAQCEKYCRIKGITAEVV